MTTVQLNIPDQQAAALETHAQAHGLTVEQWLMELVKQSVSTVGPALPDAATMSNQERAQEFVVWAQGHRPTPPLSDAAISRTAMYPDRW